MDDLEASKIFAVELTALCHRHGIMLWTTGQHIMATPRVRDGYHYEAEKPSAIGNAVIISRVLP